jgi:TonB-dependent SusC/RagA subfamily outer membrane receptor
LAGVQVTGSEGSPDAQVQIRVRGGGSITQDNSPLYVVDGIIVDNALSTLSPQDIQSIDVLKDASATAIYGARGANGVVIITTKAGHRGKSSVSYNGYIGFQKVPNELAVMNPYDFVLNDNPIFKNVKKVYIKEYSSLSLNSPAVPVLRQGNLNVAAVAKMGKGTVFAVGDPWFYNEYTDGRKIPPDFQNYPAAEDLVKWAIRQTK